MSWREGEGHTFPGALLPGNFQCTKRLFYFILPSPTICPPACMHTLPIFLKDLNILGECSRPALNIESEMYLS